METSGSPSFFHGIRSRELSVNGFQAKTRPYIDDLALDFTEIGALALNHYGRYTPPMAVSFCKKVQNSHIFAVSDEDGYLSFFNSSKRFSPYLSWQENAEKAKVHDWLAHRNAIFDICWIKGDSNILTASGDQTIVLWDVLMQKCTGKLFGHTGSVKSLSSHPTNSDIILSGSRDGSFALWDLRCKVTNKDTSMPWLREGCIRPAWPREGCIGFNAMVRRAHAPPQARRVNPVKAASMSITSVLFLKDEISIATAGAVDSVVKFWDTRNLKFVVTQACPQPKPSSEKERSYGISSLSQDANGVFLTASCMDNRIYLYNVLQLDKGPIKTFSGCQIGSFYVKSTISPDGAHILSGSSDGNARVWQVNKPEAEPITLKTHVGEVTAVDWCTSDIGRIATSADDNTVRIWNINRSYDTSKKPPSCIRKRVSSIPSSEHKNLLMNEEMSSPKKDSGISSKPADEESSREIKLSSGLTSSSILGTPETQKKRLFSSLCDLQEAASGKTPEPVSDSPSSVLNPPSSMKRRTIRDYFVVAPMKL